MVRPGLVAFAALLVVVPVAGARDRCAPHRHERVAGRSAEALLFTRDYDDRETDFTGHDPHRLRPAHWRASRDRQVGGRH